MEKNKKNDRLQGNANVREGGPAGSAGKQESVPTGTKEFEKGQSKKEAPDRAKKLGDEMEIEDESTI